MLVVIFREMADNNAEKCIDFSKSWQYADIIFVVENKKVFASKMILSLWSPVFEAMFSDNFKEKDAKEIPLPGKKFDDIVLLMQVLHPPNQEITSEACFITISGIYIIKKWEWETILMHTVLVLA